MVSKHTPDANCFSQGYYARFDREHQPKQNKMAPRHWPQIPSTEILNPKNLIQDPNTKMSKKVQNKLK